jgi:hypothetical protein
VSNLKKSKKLETLFIKEVKMDKSTYEVRLAQWAKIVQASNERPSTQLLKDWLFDNNISKDQFYYWQRKVRSEAYQRLSPAITNQETTAITFAEVSLPVAKMTSKPTNATAVISFGKTRIELSEDISEVFLHRIFKEVLNA